MDIEDEDEPLNFELDIEPEELRKERAALGGAYPSRSPTSAPQTATQTAAQTATQMLVQTPSQTPPRSHAKPSVLPPADDANRNFLIMGGAAVLLIAVTVYFFYWDDWFPPNAADRIARVTEAPNGAVKYDGEIYPSEWTKDEELGGIVNQVGTAYFEAIPFLTHKVVLVTGDYADPEKVQISKSEDDRVKFTSTSKPNGTIRLVYILPADAAALEELKKIQPGQWATMRGDMLKGGMVTPDQRTLQMRGESRVLRLRTVSLEPPDESDGDDDETRP